MGLHQAGNMEVNIALDPISRRIRVASPYNPDFAPKAKMIGGRWDGISKCWTFAQEHEQHVRRICVEVYGVDTGLPKPTREGLEARLAQHLAAIVDIQSQLDKLDGVASSVDGEEAGKGPM